MQQPLQSLDSARPQRDFMVWADNTRILAILAVIFLHVAATGVENADDLGSSQWWIANVYDSLVRWSVPVFVMLSGALLLSGNKTESIFAFYRKRAAKLLVPLVFWSLFFVTGSLLKGIATGIPPLCCRLARNYRRHRIPICGFYI